MSGSRYHSSPHQRPAQRCRGFSRPHWPAAYDSRLECSSPHRNAGEDVGDRLMHSFVTYPQSGLTCVAQATIPPKRPQSRALPELCTCACHGARGYKEHPILVYHHVENSMLTLMPSEYYSLNSLNYLPQGILWGKEAVNRLLLQVTHHTEGGSSSGTKLLSQYSPPVSWIWPPVSHLAGSPEMERPARASPNSIAQCCSRDAICLCLQSEK